jgi:hypothetical protein
MLIDPPWDYGALSLAGRAAPDYATMTREELSALPVAGEVCANAAVAACDLPQDFGPLIT